MDDPLSQLLQGHCEELDSHEKQITKAEGRILLPQCEIDRKARWIFNCMFNYMDFNSLSYVVASCDSKDYRLV